MPHHEFGPGGGYARFRLIRIPFPLSESAGYLSIELFVQQTFEKGIMRMRSFGKDIDGIPTGSLEIYAFKESNMKEDVFLHVHFHLVMPSL